MTNNRIAGHYSQTSLGRLTASPLLVFMHFVSRERRPSGDGAQLPCVPAELVWREKWEKRSDGYQKSPYISFHTWTLIMDGSLLVYVYH